MLLGCDDKIKGLKVCDDGILKLLSFGLYPSSRFVFKTHRFGDWILSPPSGKSLLSWGDGQWIMSKNSVFGKLKAFKRLVLTTCSIHGLSDDIASAF